MASKSVPSGIFLLGLALGAALSCRTRPAAESGVLADGADQPGSGEVPVTFKTIRTIVEVGKERSVEGVLLNLPKSFLSRNVVLFESGSSQVATPARPRVILYSEEARFMMTFNGAASEGGDRFETIEFSPADGKFVFREVVFPKKGDMTTPVIISADNPPACRACHRSQMRPIFDTWPEWPTAYFGKVISATGGTIDARMVDDFTAFRAAAVSDSRYRFVGGLEQQANKEFQESGGGAARLSPLILNRIDGMIAGEVLRHPKYDRWKYALHGAAFGCDGFADWMPKADVQGLSLTLAQVRQKTLNSNPKASENFIRLRWLFELVGKNIQQWSPHPTVSFSFQRGPDRNGPEAGPALMGVSDLAPKLKDSFEQDPGAGSPWKRVCGKIGELAQAGS